MQVLNDHKRELKAKRDRSRFATLVQTPVTGTLVFPTNAFVKLRSVAGSAAGTTAATYKGRTIKTPLLAAGASVVAGFVERGTSLTPSAGFDVLVDMGLGRFAKIGGA